MKLNELQRKFYHVTFAQNVSSILRHGLGGKRATQRWSFSNGRVCLADSIEKAKRYANSVGQPDEWDGKFVVIEVEIPDESKLSQDSNIDGKTADGYFEYDGVIPPSHLKVHDTY